MRGETPVTFVSHTSRPGGGELALARYLTATQHPVRLVTIEEGGVWSGLPPQVETVHARNPLALASALRRCGDGQVVANSMRAAALCASVMMPRRSLAYWVRDGLTQSAMSPFALAITRQVTARRATRYLANSQWTADSVVRALSVSREKVYVVHSMSGVADPGGRVQPRLRPPTLRLLYLGRLAPWKAPHIAVQAVRGLRGQGVEVTLTIAGGAHFGEDDYAQDLRRVADATEGVTMTDHVQDIGPLLYEHDILVHCSVAPEPFGQVIVQALAAGMPVVATAGGGPDEILGEGQGGVTYSAGDPRLLAAGVVQVWEDFAALSAAALSRSSRFTDARLVAETDAVFAGWADDV